MSSEETPPGDDPDVSAPCAREQPPLSDMSLDAAVKWLESEALTPGQKAAISRGTDDVSSKLEVFKAMLGVQRSARLAANMGWLQEVIDNILSDTSRERMRIDPFFNLSVAQFLRALQEDDTKFLATLTKAVDPKVLDEARKKALVDTTAAATTAEGELMEGLRKMPPHNRERLRKLIQSLENLPPQA